MAKLMNMFLILIAIQACLLIYGNQSPENTPLWVFINSISSWGTLGFITAIVGIAAGLWIAGIAVGSLFGFKTDFIIFAPAIAGLIGLGIVFSNLGKVIYDELVARIFVGCDISAVGGCAPATFIVALTVGTLALFYVWTVVDWWRGRDF